jgi:hypothetical protein
MKTCALTAPKPSTLCFGKWRPLLVLTLFIALLGFNSAKAADSGAQTVLLNQFPLLSQKDPANYRDQTLLTAQDSVPGGTRTATVPNLACAATVYTMLERGRGNQQAMIDDFYPDPRKFNGDSPGAKRPAYVGSDAPFDSLQIIASLRSGQPVILHGYGGPLKEHFVVAVGFKAADDGKQILTALDPFPGNDSDKPGKRIEIDLGTTPLVHPIMHDIVFQKIRLIANRNQPDPPAATTDKYTVAMKDGTVLVGTIQIHGVKFNASYGAIDVNLGEIVTFNDGFLTLADGSKLKGGFSGGTVVLETSRGEMSLPFESVVSIAKRSATANPPSNSIAPSASTLAPPRTIIRTLPDYYGFYAVMGSRLVELKPAFDFRGQPLASLNPDVEFLAYGGSVAASDELYKMQGPPKDSRSLSLQDRLEELGHGRWPGTVQIEMRSKPVPGQTEMLSISPKSPLTPGYYQLRCSPGWVYFTVPGANQQNTISPETSKPVAVGGASPTTSSSGLRDSVKDGYLAGVVVDPSRPADLYEQAAAAQADSFDTHVREFPYAYDKVWNVVSSLLADQKETVLKSDKNTGVLETAMTKHKVLITYSWQKLSLSIQRTSDTSTRVSLKFCYYTDVSDKRRGEGYLVPHSSALANAKAKAFLDKISKR